MCAVGEVKGAVAAAMVVAEVMVEAMVAMAAALPAAGMAEPGVEVSAEGTMVAVVAEETGRAAVSLAVPSAVASTQTELRELLQTGVAAEVARVAGQEVMVAMVEKMEARCRRRQARSSLYTCIRETESSRWRQGCSDCWACNNHTRMHPDLLETL